MPSRRLVLRSHTSSYHYHCVSRVVDRNFVFGVLERDVFRKILRQVEGFSGVKVITWTILSNHFHVLLEVPPPPREAPSDDEILTRCRSLYSRESMTGIEAEFASARQSGGSALEELRARYLKRMWDLSEFMKTLKQKFTAWFNRKHVRVGTLWESRFKSVVVEGSWKCLLKVAAYIDLNAVRAGLVDDPKDYRWCGYCDALCGDRQAQRGLACAVDEVRGDANWHEVAARYRKVLFGIGEETSVRAGITREAVASAFAAGGKLTLAQLLRCRIRYFTDGMAIGSESFLDRLFKTERAAFSAGRTSGSRKMRGGEWGGLRTARALRVRAIEPGGSG